MDAPSFERFQSLFRGELVLPSDEGYEAGRRVWNAAIDNHPALIARSSGVVGGARAVEFAREHELLVAVRGGAHNVAGLGTCDGGIVIDLSRMRGIRLDLVRRTVRARRGLRGETRRRDTGIRAGRSRARRVPDQRGMEARTGTW